MISPLYSEFYLFVIDIVHIGIGFKHLFPGTPQLIDTLNNCSFLSQQLQPWLPFIHIDPVQDRIQGTSHILYTDIEILHVRHEGTRVMGKLTTVGPVFLVKVDFFCEFLLFVQIGIRQLEQSTLSGSRIIQKSLDPQTLENAVLFYKLWISTEFLCFF